MQGNWKVDCYYSNTEVNEEEQEKMFLTKFFSSCWTSCVLLFSSIPVFSAAYTSPLFEMQSDNARIHAAILFIFIANSPSTHSLLFTMISQKGKLIIFIPIYHRKQLDLKSYCKNFCQNKISYIQKRSHICGSFWKTAMIFCFDSLFLCNVSLCF